jgi:hypothetical protein
MCKMTIEIEPKQKPPRFAKSIKAFLLLSLISTFITFLMVLGIYLKASGNVTQLEKKVTASLADIAMALTYAHITDTPPPDKNWLRRDFLQDSFSAILSPRLASLAAIDSKGTYIELPYILRVYTSEKQHRFLLIAQPNPNLMRFLIPSHAIVIDSQDMILRRVPTLKNINRIVSNKNPLDGENGISLKNEIEQFPPISMLELVGRKNRWGFQVPSNVPSNYKVYNAPRYHPFSEEFIEKAIRLSLQSGTEEQLDQFKYEISRLTELPDLILFTTKGRKKAWKAKRAFVHLYPEKSQAIGTLKLGREGFIEEAHILPEMSTEKDVVMLFGKKNQTHVPVLSLLMLKLEQQQLQRTQRLTLIAYTMHTLINRQRRTHQQGFNSSIKSLLKEWAKEQEQEEKELSKTLLLLLKQNPSVEFIDWLELTGYKTLLWNQTHV